MSRLFRTIAATAFLLTTVVGTVIVLLQNSTAAAQESETERVIKGDRLRLPVFGIEVLVDGRPLHARYERGRLYVNAVQGAEYELRLRNSSTDRVAVALSVDGLNTIDAGQTSAWNASKWVIEPHQTITITGWQMSSERARRFYFTNEQDSYARKLGRKANIGVISAVFFRERRNLMPVTKGRPAQPASEPQLQAEASRDNRASRAATGIGRSVRNDVSWIDMELDSRPAAEFIVRYEYSHNRYCPEPK